jgi:hypothetical protein
MIHPPQISPGLFSLERFAIRDSLFGTWLHNTALTGRYCLQAYARLATVIDLNSGKRCDLEITPVPVTGHADKATAAISPGGKRLAAVGIGLNADSYTPIKKRGMILPNSSVVLYDITDGADIKLKNKIAGNSSTAYDVLIKVANENERKQIHDMLDRAAQGMLPPKP